MRENRGLLRLIIDICMNEICMSMCILKYLGRDLGKNIFIVVSSISLGIQKYIVLDYIRCIDGSQIIGMLYYIFIGQMNLMSCNSFNILFRTCVHSVRNSMASVDVTLCKMLGVYQRLG